MQFYETFSFQILGIQLTVFFIYLNNSEKLESNVPSMLMFIPIEQRIYTKSVLVFICITNEIKEI